MINEYGDLDQLLNRASEIKQNKRRENLLEFADQAILSRSLVTLKKDVPIKSQIEEFKISSELELNKLIPFLKTHGFKSLLKKYENIGEPQTNITKSDININSTNNIKEYSSIAKKYELIENKDQLIKFLEYCYDKSVISFDCETNSLDAKTADLVGISLSCEEGLACYIPLRHGLRLDNHQSDFNFDNINSFNQVHFEDAIELIRPILEDKSILKIGHNIKFDALVLKQTYNGSINIDPIGDTMCLSYVVDSGRVDSHKLDHGFT